MTMVRTSAPLRLAYIGQTCRLARGWTRLAIGENRVFAILLVLHVIPIWAFTHLVTQDGPAHLENADIIRRYYDPAAGILRQYYALNLQLTPNWFGDVMLAGLLSTMPGAIAEKVFQSGYAILLPISVRYAVSAARPDASFLAVLVFPFILGFPFNMGFYAFSYSLAMFFFVSGYWLRHRERFSPRQTGILAILVVLLYLCHAVSLVAAFVEIAVLATAMSLLEVINLARWHRLDPRAFKEVVQRRLLGPACACTPTITLLAVYAIQRSGPGLSFSITWTDKLPLKSLLYQQVTLYSLVSFDKREIWLSVAVVCLIGALVVYVLLSHKGQWRWTLWDGFPVLAAIYAAMYLIGPSEVGGVSYLQERLNFFPFLAIILWLAPRMYGAAARRWTQISAAVIAIGFLALHSIEYRALNGYVDEYLSASQLVATNSTLLPIYFSQEGDTADSQLLERGEALFINAAGYIAVDRSIVDLGNYQAGQTHYFPTLFRPERNPTVYLDYQPLDAASGELRAVPQGISTYPEQTGGAIDYVLVWGIRNDQRAKQTTTALLKQLRDGYILLYQSHPRGLVQLYGRRDGIPDRH